MSNESPLMRQWLALKREIPPGAILLFRLGDFYEMFGEDATVAAPICGLSLVTRNGTPMCGFPCHLVCTYLAKFIRNGKSVALCDEMEGRKEYGGLIRREITRIVTPGTVEKKGVES